MNGSFCRVCLAILVAAFLAVGLSSDQTLLAKPEIELKEGGSDLSPNAQPKVFKISATIDGSGRMIVTRQKVKYEHKHWGPPADVRFGAVAWSDLDETLPGWSEESAQLDLTKARIIERKGRDVVALETTLDGFDLYFSDSPDGAGRYDVTISIPRIKDQVKN
jgi:hypothetical protein